MTVKPSDIKDQGLEAVNTVINKGQENIQQACSLANKAVNASLDASRPALDTASRMLRNPKETLTNPLSSLADMGEAVKEGFDELVKFTTELTEFSASRKQNHQQTTPTDPIEKRDAAFAEEIVEAIEHPLEERDDLTKLPKVGPAMLRRLREAGIHNFRQIAEPTAADKKKLAPFANMKAYQEWVTEAKKQIN